MGALLKLVLGFAGGPSVWFTTIIGWLYDALAWCVKHWKVVLAAAALIGAFAFGVHRGRIGDAKLVERANKELAVAKEQLATLRAENAIVEAEHGKETQDVKDDAARIDAKAKKDGAVRQVAYNKIKKELEDYVRNHSQPTEPGSCPTDTDIGDDGLQLIAHARAARVPGASTGQ